MQYIIAYIASFIAFLAVDAVWLTTATKRLYRPILGDTMRDKPRLGVAGVFYAMYIVGVQVFAVYPLSQHYMGVGNTASTLAGVFLWGYGLGAMAYATYDLTNLSVAKGWVTKIAVIDIIWGSTLTGAITLAGFLALRVAM